LAYGTSAVFQKQGGAAGDRPPRDLRTSRAYVGRGRGAGLKLELALRAGRRLPAGANQTSVHTEGQTATTQDAGPFSRPCGESGSASMTATGLLVVEADLRTSDLPPGSYALPCWNAKKPPAGGRRGGRDAGVPWHPDVVDADLCGTTSEQGSIPLRPFLKVGGASESLIGESACNSDFKDVAGNAPSKEEKPTKRGTEQRHERHEGPEMDKPG